MKKGYRVSVEHLEKINIINKLFEPKEIATYLRTSISAVSLWISGKRTPTKRFHAGIDLLYAETLDYIDKAPATVQVKMKSGEFITLPNVLKL